MFVLKIGGDRTARCRPSQPASGRLGTIFFLRVFIFWKTRIRIFTCPAHRPRTIHNLWSCVWWHGQVCRPREAVPRGFRFVQQPLSDISVETKKWPCLGGILLKITRTWNHVEPFLSILATIIRLYAAPYWFITEWFDSERWAGQAKFEKIAFFKKKSVPSLSVAQIGEHHNGSPPQLVEDSFIFAGFHF